MSQLNSLSDYPSCDHSDVRFRRLLFRSWHRGTQESDFILGSFAETCLPRFCTAQLDRFEALLDCTDPELFDWMIGVVVMGFAFTQGVFPKPPDFSKLPAFDISFFAGHPRFALFTLTALATGFLVAFALLSARVRAFWQRAA